MYYDVEKHGIPINDLDCIYPVGTYSSNLISRQNIYPRQQEVVDYIALFRYITLLVGTPIGAFEIPGKAKAWMEGILPMVIDPTETFKILANNII